MMRTTVAAMIPAMFCVVVSAYDHGCPTRGFEETTVTFQQYSVRTIRNEGQGCLEVRKSGKLVYSEQEAERYVVGNTTDEGLGNPAIKPGSSVTGSGKPELLFASWTGGAHCCFSFTILELGDKPTIIAKLDAKHSDGAHFADLNHDGKYEFVSNDWTFAYWHASFAESPAPAVVLALRKD